MARFDWRAAIARLAEEVEGKLWVLNDVACHVMAEALDAEAHSKAEFARYLAMSHCRASRRVGSPR